MGLSIGPVSNVLSALRGAPEFGQARLRGDAPPRPESAEGAQGRDPFAPRQQSDPTQVRAGFGEGTLSPQLAAFRTLDRTVQSVRDRQPTIDEIRERFQTQAAERRAETFRETRGESVGNPTDSTVPDEPLAANRPPEPEGAQRPAETDRGNRPSPAEFRAARIERTGDQERTERPRLDVRV